MNKEILDFQICKRLYDAGVRVESDTCRSYDADGNFCDTFPNYTEIQTPALTIKDGLELIKNKGWIIDKHQYEGFEGPLKECVEKSLVYLLDNNLLGNTK